MTPISKLTDEKLAALIAATERDLAEAAAMYNETQSTHWRKCVRNTSAHLGRLRAEQRRRIKPTGNYVPGAGWGEGAG